MDVQLSAANGITGFRIDGSAMILSATFGGCLSCFFLNIIAPFISPEED